MHLWFILITSKTGRLPKKILKMSVPLPMVQILLPSSFVAQMLAKYLPGPASKAGTHPSGQNMSCLSPVIIYFINIWTGSLFQYHYRGLALLPGSSFIISGRPALFGQIQDTCMADHTCVITGDKHAAVPLPYLLVLHLPVSFPPCTHPRILFYFH